MCSYMIYLLAPSPTEYADLETFLKKRREKKRREKERKKQPLISSFFKRIKMEETNYDGDDENERYVPQIVTGRARLIRSHSSARFCFELSGNLN